MGFVLSCVARDIMSSLKLAAFGRQFPGAFTFSEVGSASIDGPGIGF